MFEKRTLSTIILLMLTLPLVACQSVARAQQSLPTAASKVADVVDLTLAPNPTRVPGLAQPSTLSDTWDPAGQSLSSASEQKPVSIYELHGQWLNGETSLYIQLPSTSVRSDADGLMRFDGLPGPLAAGLGCVLNQMFTLENGMITFGTASFICLSSTSSPGSTAGAWQDSPQSQYEVEVTYESGKPGSLRFTLIGEDENSERKAFLDGVTFTRLVGPRP